MSIIIIIDPAIAGPSSSCPQLPVDDNSNLDDLDGNRIMDLVLRLVDNDSEESDDKSIDSIDDSNAIYAPVWSKKPTYETD